MLWGGLFLANRLMDLCAGGLLIIMLLCLIIFLIRKA